MDTITYGNTVSRYFTFKLCLFPSEKSVTEHTRLLLLALLLSPESPLMINSPSDPERPTRPHSLLFLSFPPLPFPPSIPFTPLAYLPSSPVPPCFSTFPDDLSYLCPLLTLHDLRNERFRFARKGRQTREWGSRCLGKGRAMMHRSTWRLLDRRHCYPLVSFFAGLQSRCYPRPPVI